MKVEHMKIASATVCILDRKSRNPRVVYIGLPFHSAYLGLMW